MTSSQKSHLYVTRATPLGTPVDPDVYIMIAVSELFGDDSDAAELLPVWSILRKR